MYANAGRTTYSGDMPILPPQGASAAAVEEIPIGHQLPLPPPPLMAYHDLSGSDESVDLDHISGIEEVNGGLIRPHLPQALPQARGGGGGVSYRGIGEFDSSGSDEAGPFASVVSSHSIRIQSGSLPGGRVACPQHSPLYVEQHSNVWYRSQEALAAHVPMTPWPPHVGLPTREEVLDPRWAPAWAAAQAAQ